MFDLHRRAELVLENADVLDARLFVSANDIVSENAKLNLAFVANLFKNHSGLDSSEVLLPEDAISDLETREERSEWKGGTEGRAGIVDTIFLRIRPAGLLTKQHYRVWGLFERAVS